MSVGLLLTFDNVRQQVPCDLTMSHDSTIVRVMRDDIHNKAAISPALRSLLKLALRPADQENPARLRDLAIKPLLAELRANISARVVQELGQEQAQPALFGRGDVAAVGGSRLQGDVLHMDGLEQDDDSLLAEVMELLEGHGREAFGSAFRANALRRYGLYQRANNQSDRGRIKLEILEAFAGQVPPLV